jgi:hypothetical protein
VRGPGACFRRMSMIVHHSGSPRKAERGRGVMTAQPASRLVDSPRDPWWSSLAAARARSRVRPCPGKDAFIPAAIYASLMN